MSVTTNTVAKDGKEITLPMLRNWFFFYWFFFFNVQWKNGGFFFFLNFFSLEGMRNISRSSAPWHPVGIGCAGACWAKQPGLSAARADVLRIKPSGSGAAAGPGRRPRLPPGGARRERSPAAGRGRGLRSRRGGGTGPGMDRGGSGQSWGMDRAGGRVMSSLGSSGGRQCQGDAPCPAWAMPGECAVSSNTRAWGCPPAIDCNKNSKIPRLLLKSKMLLRSGSCVWRRIFFFFCDNT